jgi:L-ascorbate metabolism protein UlaG (beta-lactamase superfamily)
MTTTRITHIGGPTALLEVGGWRLLTDPTFDPQAAATASAGAPAPTS